MKKRMVFLLLFVITTSLAYLAYAKRLQIDAGLWHWRHGHSTIVGDFRVPVPDGWLPMRWTEAKTLLWSQPTQASTELCSRTYQ